MADDNTMLLPCPFCGGEAKRITLEQPEEHAGGDVIYCTGVCGASTHIEFGHKENLVSLWNTPASHASDVWCRPFHRVVDRHSGKYIFVHVDCPLGSELSFAFEHERDRKWKSAGFGDPEILKTRRPMSPNVILDPRGAA